MIITILYYGTGILFGLSIAFWYTSTKLKKANDIGDSKGDEYTYTQNYTPLIEKNYVSSHFDLHTYDV